LNWTLPVVKLPPCPKTLIAVRLPESDPALGNTIARLLTGSIAYRFSFASTATELNPSSPYNRLWALIVPPQLLLVKLPGEAEQVPKALSAMMSPGHPELSPAGVHPIAEPSGSRYIRSRVTLPPSATNRLPCASTARPVGCTRLASVGELELQLLAAKPPPQVPNTRCAVWLVSGESYSSTPSREASDM
jgi:hypothetical protein